MPIVNGTTYSDETPDRVIEVLEDARASRENGKPCKRLWILYGDKNTGRHWKDTTDLKGYVGRSTGEDKIPLLIKTKRSMGGEAILDSDIIEIRSANGGQILYRRGFNEKPVGKFLHRINNGNGQHTSTQDSSGAGT